MKRSNTGVTLLPSLHVNCRIHIAVYQIFLAKGVPRGTLFSIFLLGRPKDFIFQEVVTLLAGFGYVLNQSGSGSRGRLEHTHCAPIFMHRPHPSPALKPYQIEQVLDVLHQEGLL